MNYPIVGNLNDIMGWDKNMTVAEAIDRLADLAERDRAKEVDRSIPSFDCVCPNCGGRFFDEELNQLMYYKFCPDCGQRLGWGFEL